MMTEENRIKEFHSNIIQFIITNHDPEFESRFAKAKAQHGSVFLFHGSGPENWYSILRNGLKVLSNTKYMTAGAAMGKGIYVSCEVNYIRLNYGGIVYDFVWIFNEEYVWVSSSKSRQSAEQGG